MQFHFYKKALVTALTWMLLICFTIGCAPADGEAQGPTVLEEPAYIGKSSDGYLLFRFKWSKARDLWYYDMAIYLAMDGYEERSRLSFTDKNETSAEIPFLKGINTDTATYRIKIHALQSGNDDWSEIWQIAFVNGEYTVTGSAPDFDPPKPTARPASADAPSPAPSPAPHAFPEPLMTYAAREQGVESIDLSGAVILSVQVNHCEYGEPTQTVTDPAVVTAAAEAASGITVTGGSDGVSSTGTHYIFQFQDGDGNTLAAFAFQDGMLMENDGRYPVSGLDQLYAVDGIMLTDDWEAYRAAEAEKENAYAETFRPAYPESVFALSGYGGSLLEGIDPARIGYIRVRVDWNDYAGTLEARDPDTIRALYEALSRLRVTKKLREDDKSGQKWDVYCSFQPVEGGLEGFSMNTYISFQGDAFLSDLLDGGAEMPYAVEGLTDFFDSADAKVLQYLKESRNAKKPDPKYS